MHESINESSSLCPKTVTYTETTTLTFALGLSITLAIIPKTITFTLLSLKGNWAAFATTTEISSEGGISLTSPVFQRVQMTLVDIANLSLLVSQISGQLPIIPLLNIDPRLS